MERSLGSLFPSPNNNSFGNNIQQHSNLSGSQSDHLIWQLLFGSSLFRGRTVSNKEYFSLINFLKILLITYVLPRNRLGPFYSWFQFLLFCRKKFRHYIRLNFDSVSKNALFPLRPHLTGSGGGAAAAAGGGGSNKVSGSV